MNRLSKVEKKMLMHQKLEIEGKSMDEAIREVNRDTTFINNFNFNLKQKKLQLKEIETKQQKLNEQFKKSFEKLKDQKYKSILIPIKKHESHNIKYSNTFQLRRILNFLGLEKNPTATDIYKGCGMNCQQCKDGLLFLIKLGKVVEVKDVTVKRYCLK